MTGLDPVSDHILEISCIITNPDLEILQEGPQLIIHQTDSILSSMNEWCVINHEKVLSFNYLLSDIFLYYCDSLTTLTKLTSL